LISEVEALHLVHHNYQIARKFIEVEVTRQVSFIRKNIACGDFDLKLIIRKHGRTSIGGVRTEDGVRRPFISIAATPALLLLGSDFYREYDCFSKDPDIGDCSGSWKKILAAYISHELAHALHKFMFERHKTVFYMQNRDYHKKLDCSFSHHNYMWQTMYCYLRRNLVNDHDFENQSWVPPVEHKIKAYPVAGLGQNVVLYSRGAELYGYWDRRTSTLFTMYGHKISNTNKKPNHQYNIALLAA
jgi:hypothetical protein